MVERQLRRRGIGDERVLEAMAAVPRELFVPERERRRAYADSALPIGGEQTISQPWIVAAICQGLELSGDERVLEIGTGSGYSTAVLRPACAPRWSASSASRGSARGGARAARRARHRQRRGPGRRRQPRGPRPRSVRGDRRPRHRPGSAAEPARPARVGRSHGDPDRRGASRHADRAHRTERLPTGVEASDDRPLPLRAAARRGGRSRPVEERARAIVSARHVRASTRSTSSRPAFVDQLKRGRKTATIRLGDKSRKYERGQLVCGSRSATSTARGRRSSPRSSTTSR